MNGKPRISHQQLLALLAVFNQVGMVLFLPAPLAHTAGPDAWLAVPAGMVVGAFPGSLLLGWLVRRHPGETWPQLIETCLGKWLGKPISILMAAFSFFLVSLIIRNIMDFASIAFLPGTPVLVVGFLFAAVIVYGAYTGAEPIARLAALVTILVIITILFMGAGLSDEMDLIRVRPYLGAGITPVLRAAWPTTGWFGEFLAIAPFVCIVRPARKALRAMLWGNAMAALLLTVLVIGTLAVFGAPLTSKFAYPVYSAARQVSVGQFLERLEIGILTVWLSGMLAKAASCMWSASTTLSGCLGLKRDRWLLPVLGAGALWLTQIWTSEVQQTWFSSFVWTPLMLPLEYAVPALLLLASWLRFGQRPGVAA